MFNLNQPFRPEIRAISSRAITSSKHHRSFNELKGQATVDAVIKPESLGRVRFQGSWWPARCEQNIILLPGNKVNVVGHDNITLLVEPVQ